MTSPLLALFGRSLREDTRGKMTYFARVGLVLLILLFLLTVRSSFGWGNAPGLRFFGTVVFINLFFIVLAGFSYFASAITEEKEEMTLGLLRMTNLNPLSILLGKSTSRVIGALLLLAAQLPFTFLAISLGGVAMRQVLAAYCTLGAFIVFLANLALFASVICRRSTAAAALTGVVLFQVYAVIPWIGLALAVPARFGLLKNPGAFLVGFQQVQGWVEEASPISRLSAILSTGFADGPLGIQVWSNLVAGAICFLLAWAVFEVFCSEQQESAPSRGLLVRRGFRWRFLGAGRVWPLAIQWKDFHFLCGGKFWLLIKWTAYGLFMGSAFYVPRLLWRSGSNPSLKDFGYFVVWASFVTSFAEMAFVAASVFKEERRWKTLSSLATLPMNMGQIARRKVLGCVPALLPALFYLAAGLLLILPDVAELPLWQLKNWTEEGVVVLTFGFLQGVFFLHLVALLSLYLKRGALPLAVALYFVGIMFIGVFSAASGGRSGALWILTLLLMVAIGMSALKIVARLRELAAED